LSCDQDESESPSSIPESSDSLAEEHNDLCLHSPTSKGKRSKRKGKSSSERSRDRRDARQREFDAFSEKFDISYGDNFRRSFEDGGDVTEIQDNFNRVMSTLSVAQQSEVMAKIVSCDTVVDEVSFFAAEEAAEAALLEEEGPIGEVSPEVAALLAEDAAEAASLASERALTEDLHVEPSPSVTVSTVIPSCFGDLTPQGHFSYCTWMVFEASSLDSTYSYTWNGARYSRFTYADVVSGEGDSDLSCSQDESDSPSPISGSSYYSDEELIALNLHALLGKRIKRKSKSSSEGSRDRRDVCDVVNSGGSGMSKKLPRVSKQLGKCSKPLRANLRRDGKRLLPGKRLPVVKRSSKLTVKQSRLVKRQVESRLEESLREAEDLRLLKCGFHDSDLAREIRYMEEQSRLEQEEYDSYLEDDSDGEDSD
jgi:hypothetical protein